MLRSEMPRKGQWLFVHRSYLPIILLPVLALTLFEGRIVEAFGRLDLPPWWDVAWYIGAICAGLTGVLIRAIAVGYSAPRTSGRNTHAGQVADDLNTTGLYSLVRNPLYLGNLVITLGVLLPFRSWQLLVIVLLAFLLYYERIIFAEEAFLEEKFGDRYREWASATPVLFPRLRGWKSPPRSFQLRKAIRNEYASVFGVFAAVYVFRVGLGWIDDWELAWEPEWLTLMGVVVGVYLITMFVKRYTRLLRVS